MEQVKLKTIRKKKLKFEKLNIFQLVSITFKKIKLYPHI